MAGVGQSPLNGTGPADCRLLRKSNPLSAATPLTYLEGLTLSCEADSTLTVDDIHLQAQSLSCT